MVGPRSPFPARVGFAITAAVAVVAVGLQLVLVIIGASVLVPEERPSLVVRLLRLISYFTIQSNVLVLITSVQLARRSDRDGRHWPVLRAAALVGITITGVVHWFLLRPLLDLHGPAALCDTLLHVVIPLLAVLGWLVFGPRPRFGVGVLLRALVWPLAWTVWTLSLGAITGWYPYPFLDPGLQGVGAVVIACLGILAVFVVVAALFLLGDRRLRPSRTAAARTP